MKKKNLIILVIIAVGLFSCEKESEKLNSENTENPYSLEELLKAVEFVGEGKFETETSMSTKSGKTDVTLVKIVLGKKGNPKCDGSGICHLWIGPWQIFDQAPIRDDRAIFMEYNGTADLSDLENLRLFLADQPDIDLRHVAFPIDEEIIIYNELESASKTEKVIPAQKAVFNKNLGQFGGYELKVARSAQ